MAEVKSTEIEVKSKDAYYRGLKVDDLKLLDVREVAKYLPSSSRRFVLRNFQILESFINRCEKTVASKKKIRTHLREIVIVPRMVGMNIGIYNGKSYTDVLINADMIGHRLGEFSLTRTRVSHGEAGIGATKSSKTAKK